MYFILRWIINAAILLLVAYIVPGFTVDSFLTALIVALVLGIVNAVIKPILIIISLPITILTLGLFSFVINALLIWAVASFIEGFAVSGFMPAFIGGLLLWVGSWITSAVVKGK
ncbi:MAG: phage holin family protein [Patescibacteria group bacterium]|jgi:putative membrane protein